MYFSKTYFRHPLEPRSSVPATLEHWADPTQFINKHRRLDREFRPVPVPTGTYKEYAGFKGI